LFQVSQDVGPTFQVNTEPPVDTIATRETLMYYKRRKPMLKKP
jgi:hypothetical protein